MRALATEPRALLLDEVTSALDPELVGEVLALDPRPQAPGMTMLIATHEMGFAREVADEVCFLHDGAVVERGEPERIFTAPEHPETQRFLRRLLGGEPPLVVVLALHAHDLAGRRVDLDLGLGGAALEGDAPDEPAALAVQLGLAELALRARVGGADGGGEADLRVAHTGGVVGAPGRLAARRCACRRS